MLLALFKNLRQLFCRLSICLQVSNRFLVIGSRGTFSAARLPPPRPRRGVHQDLQRQAVSVAAAAVDKLVRTRPLHSASKTFQHQKFPVLLLVFVFLFFLTLKFLTSTSLSFHLQQLLQFYLNLDESMTKLWKRYIEPGVRFINLPKCRNYAPFLLRLTSAKCHLLFFPSLFLPCLLVFLRNMQIFVNTYVTLIHMPPKNEEIKVSTAFSFLFLDL